VAVIIDGCESLLRLAEGNPGEADCPILSEKAQGLLFQWLVRSDYCEGNFGCAAHKIKAISGNYFP
jgi:hypothetical protein